MNFTDTFIKTHSLFKLDKKSFKSKTNKKIIKTNLSNIYNKENRFFKTDEAVNQQIKILNNFSNFNYDVEDKINLDYYKKNLKNLNCAFSILNDLSNVNSIYNNVMTKIVHIFKSYIFCDKYILTYLFDEYRQSDIKNNTFAKICLKFKNKEFDLFNIIHKNNGEYEEILNKLNEENKNIKIDFNKLKIEYENYKKNSNLKPLKKEIFDLSKNNVENLIKNDKNIKIIKELKNELNFIKNSNHNLIDSKIHLEKINTTLQKEVNNISEKSKGLILKNEQLLDQMDKMKIMSKNILNTLPKLSSIYIKAQEDLRIYKDLDNKIIEREKLGLDCLTPRPNHKNFIKEYKLNNFGIKLKNLNGEKNSTENIMIQVYEILSKNKKYKINNNDSIISNKYSNKIQSINEFNNSLSNTDKGKDFDNIMNNLHNYASKF